MDYFLAIIITINSLIQIHAPMEALPAVALFKDEVNARNLDVRPRMIRIEWSNRLNLTPNKQDVTIAQCFTEEFDTYNRMILVDKEYFLGLPEEKQEFVIIHELGHCALDLEHSPNQKDVMFWNAGESFIYFFLDKSTALDHLFQDKVN